MIVTERIADSGAERKPIYMNMAATSLQKPPCVAEAVAEALGRLGNASRGNGDRDLNADRSAMAVRRKLAALFGFSHPERVVFTSGATQALNTAILGVAGAILDQDHGQRPFAILSTDLEHNSVLRPLYRLRDEKGIELRFARADRGGRPDYEEMRALCTPDVKIVVCTHASNLTGELVDLGRVSEIAHENGAVFIVDASQTAGAYPIDMAKTGIDILCFTGHKSLLGPQGTGGLCVRPGIAVKPLVEGGTGVYSYEERQPEAYPAHLEAGTLNGHGIAGLGAAVEYIAGIPGGPAAIHERELTLRERFVQGVRTIPGITIYGPGGRAQDGDSGDQAGGAGTGAITDDTLNCTGDCMPIVALNLEGMPSWEAADVLAQEYRIAVRAGAHCAPRMHRALGTEESGAVRFSFGMFNTEEEVDAAVEALREIAESIQD